MMTIMLMTMMIMIMRTGDDDDKDGLLTGPTDTGSTH